MDARPWLSVITVVKDDADGLRRTAVSLAEQDLAGVEYIVVDSSVDEASVPSVLAAFPQLQPTVEWTPPAGIYSAMNRGLELATGEVVYFANAGDVLYDSSILARVRQVLGESGAPWGFGPVEVVERDGRRVITPDWDYEQERGWAFSRGHFPAHQGTFARLDLLRELGRFDTTYAVAADYAMFLRMSQVADPCHLPLVIASFHEGGLSTIRWRQSFQEFHAARRSILRPSGLAAVREHVATWRQFVMVFLVREVRPFLGYRGGNSARR